MLQWTLQLSSHTGIPWTSIVQRENYSHSWLSNSRHFQRWYWVKFVENVENDKPSLLELKFSSDEKVLVIGSGASGVDVAYYVSKVATKTTISCHGGAMKTVPSGVYKRSDVKKLTENGAIFDDETEEEFSVIILATGYLYSFPFLSMDCGITIDDNFIRPLFKHCININYPSMAFIGMPFLVHPPLISYLQVKKMDWFLLEVIVRCSQF